MVFHKKGCWLSFCPFSLCPHYWARITPTRHKNVIISILFALRCVNNDPQSLVQQKSSPPLSCCSLFNVNIFASKLRYFPDWLSSIQCKTLWHNNIPKLHQVYPQECSKSWYFGPILVHLCNILMDIPVNKLDAAENKIENIQLFANCRL